MRSDAEVALRVATRESEMDAALQDQSILRPLATPAGLFVPCRLPILRAGIPNRIFCLPIQSSILSHSRPN
jgi:hypothetical protein